MKEESQIIMGEIKNDMKNFWIYLTSFVSITGILFYINPLLLIIPFGLSVYSLMKINKKPNPLSN